ncbi:MAG TPA: TIGR03767 family metallophosphoesterase [Flexivirga sp.]|uniref:TIGR03767 family metallophosphoesterase n=1 Tax=Flexivirga sp. TaxID=1962927 RepID=UPI002D16A75F|nr:TIGR03767 family metallophosphoesterase [Flexivirga sp.]HWC24350.1 TIGR03767 family metallophosphoesterase [Flexivirga sp.]
MTLIRRRTLLGGSIGGAAALTLAGARARTGATPPPTEHAITGAGTTLDEAARPASRQGYTRLTAGQGYPLIVRTDLSPARANRLSTRTGRASIVQFTDLHVIDAQSPVRFEWLHTVTGSAFRPQEALGTQGGAQLVRRVNQVGKGPFSGRTFDCVVTTGDSSDNHEKVELDWFLALMSGGSITPNTGSPTAWEGVQNAGDSLYYLPESDAPDTYKKAGFPTIPAYFKQATATHTSDGLNTPWYSVFGNHDDSIGGMTPSDSPALADLYTGRFKFTGFANASGNSALRGTVAGAHPAIPEHSRLPKSRWEVTADDRRAPFTPREFMSAHLDPSVDGPGPHGHGFTLDALAQGIGYYDFPIAPGVVGIAMDSTNRAGFVQGSIGDAQFRWIQRILEASSSRYYDSRGTEHRQDVTDRLFVLFSHHTSDSMSNLLPAPDLLELRHSGPEVVSMLQRYPNVIAWANGHTHRNRITPHRHDDPTRSFWEINTASHIDYPQHARIIDVCDNADGTLSLFTTLIESAAPYQAAYDDGSSEALASLYRELSYNDIHHNNAKRMGTYADRNTELLLKNPMA